MRTLKCPADAGTRPRACTAFGGCMATGSKSPDVQQNPTGGGRATTRRRPGHTGQESKNFRWSGGQGKIRVQHLDREIGQFEKPFGQRSGRNGLHIQTTILVFLPAIRATILRPFFQVEKAHAQRRGRHREQAPEAENCQDGGKPEHGWEFTDVAGCCQWGSCHPLAGVHGVCIWQFEPS